MRVSLPLVCLLVSFAAAVPRPQDDNGDDVEGVEGQDDGAVENDNNNNGVDDDAEGDDEVDDDGVTPVVTTPAPSTPASTYVATTFAETTSVLVPVVCGEGDDDNGVNCTVVPSTSSIVTSIITTITAAPAPTGTTCPEGYYYGNDDDDNDDDSSADDDADDGAEGDENENSDDGNNVDDTVAPRASSCIPIAPAATFTAISTATSTFSQAPAEFTGAASHVGPVMGGIAGALIALAHFM